MNAFSKFLVLLILSNSVFATSITIIERTPEEEVELALEMFNEADLVFSVSRSVFTENGAREHIVEEVWKGEVGGNVFIYGTSDYSETFLMPGNVIIYANREIENSPINVIHWVSPVTEPESYIETYSALAASYSPSLTYTERSYNPTFMNWPLMYIFISLIFGSVIVFYFVNYQVNRNDS